MSHQFELREYQFDNYEHLKIALEKHKVETLELIGIVCLAMLESKRKSLIWNYFGRLYVKEKDEKKRYVLVDRVFCIQCFENFKNDKDTTIKK